MLIVRPATHDDLDQIFGLASKTGPGMTSLPADKKSLTDKIQNSINSFKIQPTKPANEYYLFVLENIAIKKEEETTEQAIPTGAVLGVAAIRAKVGGYEPFYSYEIKEAHHKSEKLNVDKKIKFLQLCEEHNGPSIISSIFIDPQYRQSGLGKFLSMSRFMFMAEHPERFEDTVIAEMRGVIKNERSPFWDGVVKHFFDMEFSEADYLSAQGKGFIADLMPKHPIYICLLSKEVAEIIGEVHENTKPALKFLEGQGFRKDNHVDIFDAGPRIAAKVQEIKTIKDSQKLKVAGILPESEIKQKKGAVQSQYVVCNTGMDFRCVVTDLLLVEQDKAFIGEDLAEALKIINCDTSLRVITKQSSILKNLL